MSAPGHDLAAEPRIVLVGPTPPPWGGVSVHIQRVSAHLNEAGIPHRILSTTALEEGGSILPLGKSKVFSLLGHARKLGGRDVVVHSSELHGLLVAFLCALFGARVAQHFHNGRALGHALRFWWLRGVVRYLLGRLDRVYAVNSVIAEILRAIRPSLKVVELHAFVPPSQAELGRASMALDLPDGCFAIGWCGITVGERAEIYGFEFFLNVLECLRQKGWPVVGVIGASDGFSPEVLPPSARASISRLQSALIFVPQSDPYVAYMKALSVFVRPTSTDGDALSIREAMSLGVPVVASSVVCRPDGCETFRLGEREACVDKVIAALAHSRAQSGLEAVRADVPMARAGQLEFGFDELEIFIKHLQVR